MNKPTVLIHVAHIERDGRGREYLKGYPDNLSEASVNGQLTRSGPISSFDEEADVIETETTIYNVVSWERDYM